MANQPQAACTYLARIANTGPLARIALDERLAKDPFPVPEELTDFELAFGDLLDINNDGKREYVYVVQYPPRDEDPSSLTIEESRIRGPFGIPRNDSLQQELFVYDQSMREIEIRAANELTKALADDADRYRFVLHRNSYYIVAQRGEEPRYALKIDSSNIAQPICAFEQRASGPRMKAHALTAYEWLKQSLEADSHEGILWEYAFARSDFAVAELLIASGHSANERMDGDSLLVWAIQEERIDVVDWLLKHDADPNIASKHGQTPVQMTISDEGADVAAKLMRYGADPAPAVYDISALQQTESGHKRSLVLAAIKQDRKSVV